MFCRLCNSSHIWFSYTNLPRSSRAVQSLSPSRPWRNPASNQAFNETRSNTVNTDWYEHHCSSKANKRWFICMALKIEYPKKCSLPSCLPLNGNTGGNNHFQTKPSAISKEEKTCISNLFKSQIKREHGYSDIYPSVLVCFYTWRFPEIGAPPKSSILVGFSLINHPFWVTPHLWNPPHVHGCIWTQKGRSSRSASWWFQNLCKVSVPLDSLAALCGSAWQMTPWPKALHNSRQTRHLESSCDSGYSRRTIHYIIKHEQFHVTRKHWCLRMYAAPTSPALRHLRKVGGKLRLLTSQPNVET